MDKRTKLLESIRLKIDVETQKASVFELFQSTTLRPILKFQNELILAVIANHLSENKVRFHELKEEKKDDLIHSVLKKNLALKNTLLGSIIAFFTTDEYLFYFQNKSEINKRIVELLIKRISDQKEKMELLQRNI